MRYNPLGKTGLYVSELCLGAMTFGGRRHLAGHRRARRKEAEALVGTALDAGVNFIDTADVYSEGESERLVGAALKALARPREQVVVATKVRGRVGPGRQPGRPVARAHPREHRRAACGGSASITSTSTRSTASIRRRRSRRPCARSTTSCAPARRATSASATCRRGSRRRRSRSPTQNGLARFQSAQVYYSIAGRDIEREIAPMCQAERRRDPAVEPARRRPAVGQVRSRQEGPGRRAARVVRLPARQHGAPAARARRAAQGRRGDGRLGRARRARLAAHASRS